MNTSRSLERLTSVILLVVIGTTHVMVPTAQAGLWSWVSGYVARADASMYDTMSERQLSDYLISGDPIVDARTDDAILIGNAVLPHSSIAYEPAAGTNRQKMILQVSAYNSEPEQTDDSPFITAQGTHVRDGIVATNILPFGTRVKMPELFGDKVFVVEDRMNTRYQNHMDIWMEDKQDALKFGRRTVLVIAIR